MQKSISKNFNKAELREIFERCISVNTCAATSIGDLNTRFLSFIHHYVQYYGYEINCSATIQTSIDNLPYFGDDTIVVLYTPRITTHTLQFCIRTTVRSEYMDLIKTRALFGKPGEIGMEDYSQIHYHDRIEVIQDIFDNIVARLKPRGLSLIGIYGMKELYDGPSLDMDANLHIYCENTNEGDGPSRMPDEEVIVGKNPPIGYQRITSFPICGIDQIVPTNQLMPQIQEEGIALEQENGASEKIQSSLMANIFDDARLLESVESWYKETANGMGGRGESCIPMQYCPYSPTMSLPVSIINYHSILVMIECLINKGWTLKNIKCELGDICKLPIYHCEFERSMKINSEEPG